jgi:hypothetical protein
MPSLVRYQEGTSCTTLLLPASASTWLGLRSGEYAAGMQNDMLWVYSAVRRLESWSQSLPCMIHVVRLTWIAQKNLCPSYWEPMPRCHRQHRQLRLILAGVQLSGGRRHGACIQVDSTRFYQYQRGVKGG